MGSSSTQIATKYPCFSSSFSSSSSQGSSYFPDESPLGPATPLRFSGVPFSWEHLPGIPKKLQQNHNKKDYSIKLQLPLPPPTSTPTTTRRSSRRHGSFDDMSTRNKASAGYYNSFRRKDPFFAALVKCSKEDDHDHDKETSRNDLWTGAKVIRSISDRLGLINNLFSYCKRSCEVSESTVNLPRSRRTADHYGLINHHRRSREV